MMLSTSENPILGVSGRLASRVWGVVRLDITQLVMPCPITSAKELMYQYICDVCDKVSTDKIADVLNLMRQRCPC